MTSCTIWPYDTWLLIIITYNWMLLDCMKYYKVLLDLYEVLQISITIAEYNYMLHNSTKFDYLVLEITCVIWYYWMIWKADVLHKHCWIFSNISKEHRRLLDTIFWKLGTHYYMLVNTGTHKMEGNILHHYSTYH